MTDRQRRSEQLVHDIRAALARGVSPERIHAALVRRNVPPDKATLLLNRILSTMPGPVPPAAVVARQPGTPDHPDRGVVPAPQPVRHRRAPYFIAFAAMLLIGGLTGVFLSSRHSEAREQAAELAMRLDADLHAAREHLAHLDSRIEARRVDATQIEWLRARVARGPGSFQSADDYQAMVARYQRRRAAWNRTLPEARVVTQAFQALVDIHNAKLDSLNAVRGGSAGGGVRPTDGRIRHLRIAAAIGAQ